MSIIESLAVIIASSLASYAIVKWRREMLGEKKFDAATELYTEMLEAESIFSELNSRAPYTAFMQKESGNTWYALEAGAVPYYYVSYAYFSRRKSHREKLRRAVFYAQSILDETAAKPGVEMLELYQRLENVYGNVPPDVRDEDESQVYKTIVDAEQTSKMLTKQCRLTISAYLQ